MSQRSHVDPIATTWRSYVAELPAWGIVAGALAVSFWTQVEQVHLHGFATWEALIWGTSTDAGTVACLFLAREGAHRGTPTWGAWVLSVACAFLSIQYNVVAGVEARDWLSVEAHVWMPALALGVWFWLLHGRHRRWMLRRRHGPEVVHGEPGAGGPAEVPLPVPAASSVPEPAMDVPPAGPNQPARVPARGEVRRQLKHQRGAPSDQELRRLAERVAQRTGVSIPHARRLLRQEQQPHVLGAAAGADARTAAEAES